MPESLKWSVIGGVAVLCLGAAYLMVARGPALLLDIGGALLGCF
jgi:hypothetical protein